MKPCFVCGGLFDEFDLEPSPNGSGKQVCDDCACDIEDDLTQMVLDDEYHSEDDKEA